MAFNGTKHSKKTMLEYLASIGVRSAQRDAFTSRNVTAYNISEFLNSKRSSTPCC
ncbi:MAG: hypothetical protein ACLUDU_07850 [Butyricimonas faecihominis]